MEQWRLKQKTWRLKHGTLLENKINNRGLEHGTLVAYKIRYLKG
jgi:hypothetical protein